VIPPLRADPPGARWLLLAALCLAPGKAAAQSVVELEAGGTSLYDSYGVAAHLYTAAADGWIGIGVQNGDLVFGAAAQTSFKQDSLRIGSDVLVERYPTDLFSLGVNILGQDVRYTLVRPRTYVTVLGGWAAATNTSQFFQAYQFSNPFGALTVRQLVAPRVVLGFNGVFAARQSALASAAWGPLPNLDLAVIGGVGSNAPYGAVSAMYQPRNFAIRASYVSQGSGFRRADLPYPVQTEPDKENIQVDWQPWDEVLLGAARQNFVQDSGGTSAPITASGNSLYASARRFGFRVQAGLYDSESQGFSNLSNYFALGRSFGRWLDVDAYLLQSRPSVGPASNTPIVNLRERIIPRLALIQQVSWNDGNRVSVQFGGEMILPFGDLGISYQIVQQPFKPLDPFESVLSLSARIQLGRYATSLNTTFMPDGSVNYIATAATYLYFGQFGGMQPNLVQTQLGKFVIKGRVVDDNGQPVDGAAIDFDGDLAFTNPEGQFLLRVGRPRDYRLTVRFEEFLLPGRWEVLSAPAAIKALPEDRATSHDIVLRRVMVTVPNASPTAPADSTVPPAPEETPRQ
jgi:hypothetical protein